MLTESSRLKDIYAHPVGRDIIRKIMLQIGRSDSLINNPIVGNIKIKHLQKLSRGMIDDGFIDTLINLLNSEPDVPLKENCKITQAWWKEAVFYQIYPRSFKDSNLDGVGDLRGIIKKVDYLEDLGINAIWLSPIYDSPNDDNGYDIRDYRKIMAEFGTMEDFEQLLEKLHSRGMKLIMDLVVNHTSDEHEWFKKSLSDPESKYGDYYIFRDQPNNWTSFFSGSAWNYYEERKQYGLHLFSKKQMDLNFDNPVLRQEINDMVCWWLEKGVDGFRMDVINYISKNKGLPEGNESIGKLMGYNGIEHYFYGPHLHEYLHELKVNAFSLYNAISVGETPGVGMEMSKLLTADYRGELDMVFSFDHLETPGHVRFDDYRYDLNYFKQYMIDWMENYGNHCQPTLFYENHDNPRMVSKIDTDPKFRTVLSKLLALMQLTLRGTPFIYQGQEIGMINKKFICIDDLRDIESLNLYEELLEKMNREDAFKKILAGTRDHARTPMQWTDEKYAGFSDVQPWIYTDDDNKNFNVKSQISDKNSVWNFYKEIIAYRKKHKDLIYGDFVAVNKKDKDLFSYYRKGEDETFFIECNLSNKPIKRKENIKNGVRLYSNYTTFSQSQMMPYEAALWKLN